MDLGQEGQRRRRAPPPPWPGRAGTLQGTLGRASSASVQKRQMKVSSAPRWACAKTRGMTTRAKPADHAGRPTIPPARREHDQADQDREGRGRGQPRRDDVEPDRVGAAQQEDLERLAQGRGEPQQPAPQRGMLGVVGEDRVDDLPVEEPPPLARQGRDVGPAGPHVERLVDRDAGAAQREDDGQPGADRRNAQASRPTVQNRCRSGASRTIARARARPSIGRARVRERPRFEPRPDYARWPATGRASRSSAIEGRVQRAKRARVVPRSMPGRDLGLVGRSRSEGRGGDQGSSAFFCEIRRRTRSASRAPSNGFLKASLKPSV